MSRKATPITKPGRRHLPFGYYGGKGSHLAWLLPLLPQAPQYVEPFGGSAAVLLNRPPAYVETYNDLEGDLVNFFRVLRDDKDELIGKLELTPFSREEFALSLDIDPSLPRVERARRFYVRARQVRSGLATSASLGRWANCKDTSRSGMSGVVSRWIYGVPDLHEIADRLLRVQIENRPAIEVIGVYDGPATLFYVDPPYVHSTRNDPAAYNHEMTDDDHRELAAALNEAKGLVAVSGYDCQLMNECYPGPRWTRIAAPAKTTHTSKTKKAEVLWTNYGS